jgi:hypothetical protein
MDQNVLTTSSPIFVTIYGTTFDTNVAAAGLTLSGTTLAADGTDANISITLTPKGTGDLALGAFDLTMTGSLAATGARVTKGWFTDLETFNYPTVGGVAVFDQDVSADGNPSFSTANLVGANALNLGTSRTNDGSVRFKSGTALNDYYFQILGSNFGANIGWILPTAAPGGANYLLNVDADGTMGYTDPASLVGSYLPLAGGTMTGAIVHDPTVTGTLADYRLATEWTGGTIINAAFASGVTPATNIYGIVLDFNTNLTMTATKGITGFQIKTPSLTQSSDNTTTYIGYDLPTAGALISQTNPSSTINWKGVNIQMPNITQTQGAVNSYGVYVNGGTVTSGTKYAVFVDSGNVRLDGNVGIGQATFGASATTTLALGTGVAPADSPADAIQLYSADVGGVAGKAGLHLRDEQGLVYVVGYSSTTKSADYVILSTDGFQTIFASGTTTITLPSAAIKRRLRIAKSDVAGTNITVARAGSDTIEGNTSIVLTNQYDTLELEADGSATWYEF